MNAITSPGVSRGFSMSGLSTADRREPRMRRKPRMRSGVRALEQLQPQDERFEACCLEVENDAQRHVQVMHPGFEVCDVEFRRIG